MSERTGYLPGVPSWIDTWQPDAQAAIRFYGELLGWQAEGGPVPGSTLEHFMCRLRGRDVAAIGSPAPEGVPPAWTTHIRVADVEVTAKKVTAAGGAVLVAPFDSLDGGRMAIVADPWGATFGLWRPRAHGGAEAVNNPGAWSWSQLLTPDPEGSLAFYREVFDWETETFGEDAEAATMFRVPGYVGGRPEQPVSRDTVAGMALAPEPGEPARWQVDFWVDDVDAAVATTRRLGGDVITPAYDTSVGRQAVLSDPGGAVFSISKVTVGGPG
jgi:predicted enzyme related to lactoylglutathione lyase